MEFWPWQFNFFFWKFVTSHFTLAEVTRKGNFRLVDVFFLFSKHLGRWFGQKWMKTGFWNSPHIAIHEHGCSIRWFVDPNGNLELTRPPCWMCPQPISRSNTEQDARQDGLIKFGKKNPRSFKSSPCMLVKPTNLPAFNGEFVLLLSVRGWAKPRRIFSSIVGSFSKWGISMGWCGSFQMLHQAKDGNCSGYNFKSPKFGRQFFDLQSS